MDLFNIVILVLLAVLLVVLGAGIYSLFRGGDFARSHSNRLMRLRVAVQFVIILILAAGLWWRTHG